MAAGTQTDLSVQPWGRAPSGSMARAPAIAARRVAPQAVGLDLGQDTGWVDAGAARGLYRFDQVGRGPHYRFDFIERWAVGRSEVCQLADGLWIHMVDADLREPFLRRLAAQDWLRLCVATELCCEISPNGGEPVNLDGPGALLFLEPAGSALSDHVLDRRNRYVQVCADASALRRLYADGLGDLPPLLAAFLDGTLDRPVLRRLPLTSALLKCVEDLQSSLHEGTTRRLYFQSKAIELLCQAFQSLQDEDGFESPEASILTQRGVLKAQAVLMERFAAPPSLDDLAASVGLSRTNLCAGFRTIVGKSVFDYIQDLRMQHALVLLNERNASISEVAYAVGYTHASSFSVAVQRRFGATPRELRRRGALASL